MALTGAGGCAAPGPAPASSFRCQVQGVELLVPRADEAAVCSRFRAALERALGAAGKRSLATSPGDTLQVRLGLRRPGIASVEATQTRGGRTVTHPKIELAVSDRNLALVDIDHLADEVARQLN